LVRSDHFVSLAPQPESDNHVADVLGSVAFTPVKSDMTGNIKVSKINTENTASTA